MLPGGNKKPRSLHVVQSYDDWVPVPLIPESDAAFNGPLLTQAIEMLDIMDKGYKMLVMQCVRVEEENRKLKAQLLSLKQSGF